VIIVSILVAFSIDAWWADRQQGESLHALLDLLGQDIDADVTELRFREARSDSILERLDQLLSVGLGETRSPGADELSALAEWLFRTSQTDQSLSAYEVARGSDSWNQVPSGIKVALSEYMRGPFSVDRLRDIDAVRSLLDLSARYGGAAAWESGKGGPGLVAEQMLRYLEDPATQSWLRAHAMSVRAEAAWQRRWAKRLPLIGDSLASLR
jgi:hypothetical protein